MNTHLFTSESVSEGHPDKICDQVSDAVLDAMLKDDPNSRVACECFATTGLIIVGGEIKTNTYIDLQRLVRGVIRDIGYTKDNLRFDADSCAVLNVINEQSQDIKMGVDTGGAGDQGMMFGYACKETEELMPAPIMFAHKIMSKLAEIRKTTDLMPYLRPDAKCQVTLEYADNNEIIRLHTLVISTQHDPDVSNDRIKEDLRKYVVNLVIPEKLQDNDNYTYHVNPTGNFVIGGPHGDTGLTGRKIIVDTYGGRAPHGGGAFSGKDSTKVDRSGAYAARHLAKNIVAAGITDEVTIQLSYAIGVAEPVSIYVKTGANSLVPSSVLSERIKSIDLTPNGIIERLGLRKPIFAKTATYGHFGRDGFSWENTDLIDFFNKI